MMIAKLVRDFQPKSEELMKPKDEDERQAMITVAFQSLMNCGMYVQTMDVSYEPHQAGHQINFSMVSMDPFPYALIDGLIHKPTAPMFGKKLPG